MSGTLNLFPARVPIGQVILPDGTELKALASMEFLKALKILFERVGGTSGAGNAELAELITQLLFTEDPIQTTPDYVEPMIDHSARVADLARQTEELQSMREGNSLLAEMAVLRQQVEQLAQLISPPNPAPAYSDFLNAYAESPTRIDWERPGKIGSLTPNTVRATTLESTVATGTAPLIVASTTQVSNLNVSQLVGKTWAIPAAIGSTTPAAGNFTTLGATGAITAGADSTINTAKIGKAFTANFYVDADNAAVRVFSNNAAAGIYFQNFDATVTWAVVTVLGMKVTAGFGCNGAAPQTAFALGAAATDLPSVIALANNIQSALIANGIGS